MAPALFIFIFNFFIATSSIPTASSYAFLSSTSSRASLYNRPVFHATRAVVTSSCKKKEIGVMKMIDANILQGGAIAVAGLAVGIGLVAFTERQGERAKSRGGGLSEDMSIRITGKLMEDTETSSVKDLGSLTSKLEAALKETGGVSEEKMTEMELTETEKEKLREAADDGW